MGRQRRRINARLPKYVYKGKSAYVYRPLIDGKRKETRLCALSCNTREIWEAYEEITHIKPKETLSWLIGLYLDSDRFKELRPLTQKAYRLHSRVICEEATGRGSFGDELLLDIDTVTIRGYLDLFKDRKVEGNRRVAFLASVYKWGFQRGYCLNNPCIGITKYKETARKLYVTHEMYEAFYAIAEKPWYIRPMMEIAYLCRMRRAEILDLKRTDITDKGLITRRLKGSNTTITIWTKRLREAVEVPLKRSNHLYLFSTNSGEKLRDGTFTTSWGLLWRTNQINCTRFSFHDLKAKGVSDFEGDKQLAGGHKTNAMVATYDRRLKEVEATK